VWFRAGNPLWRLFSCTLLWQGRETSSRHVAGELSECSAVHYCGKVCKTIYSRPVAGEGSECSAVHCCGKACRYPAGLLQVIKVKAQLSTVVERYADIQQACSR